VVVDAGTRLKSMLFGKTAFILGGHIYRLGWALMENVLLSKRKGFVMTLVEVVAEGVARLDRKGGDEGCPPKCALVF